MFPALSFCPRCSLEDATSPRTSHQWRPRWSSSTARCKPQRQESIPRMSRGSQGAFTPHLSPGRTAQRRCKPGQAAAPPPGVEVSTAAPAHPALGFPPHLVAIVPSSPQPSPQPEEAEHLREVLRRRLARRRSVRTPAGAGVEARLARSPGTGPAHTPLPLP